MLTGAGLPLPRRNQEGGRGRMMKKVRKGFTLLELVIVMALFSIVMYGVLMFLLPVSKFYVRASNFETTTACVDNMKRAIEGNLKYADRVHAYSGYGTDTIDANVEKFWEEYFKDRMLMDCKGEIRVMIFDSTSNHQSGTLDDLTDFNKNGWNSGKISLRTYNFDRDKVYGTHPGDTNTVAPIDWYINQKMYGNYNYYFTLGGGDAFSGGTPEFNPADCTIRIVAKEIVRDSALGGDAFKEQDGAGDAVASFSMKNVLDATKKYTSPMMDYKIVRKDDEYKLSDDGTVFEKLKYVVESEGGAPKAHSRYQPLDAVPTTDSSYQPIFYFIFTQAETVYDAGERVLSGGKFIKQAGLPQTDPDYDEEYFKQVKKAYSATPAPVPPI